MTSAELAGGSRRPFQSPSPSLNGRVTNYLGNNHPSHRLAGRHSVINFQDSENFDTSPFSPRAEIATNGRRCRLALPATCGELTGRSRRRGPLLRKKRGEQTTATPETSISERPKKFISETRRAWGRNLARHFSRLSGLSGRSGKIKGQRESSRGFGRYRVIFLPRTHSLWRVCLNPRLPR